MLEREVRADEKRKNACEKKGFMQKMNVFFSCVLLSQIFLHESLLQIFTFFFRLFLPYYMYNLRETFMYFLHPNGSCIWFNFELAPF